MTGEIDFEQTKLKKGFRGYDPAQVDHLLQEAANTVEQLLAENARLQEEIEEQNAQIELNRSKDRLVQETLLTAQRTAEEMRIQAHQQAEAILEDARRGASNESLLARRTTEELTADIERLRAERKRYIDDFRLILSTHHHAITIIAEGEDPDTLDE